MTETNRKSRAADTREDAERVTEWVPPAQRITLKSTDEVKLRWVRTASGGQDDTENVEARLMEGFEVVRPDDPLVSEDVARGVLKVVEGRIVRKGQVLCKMDARVAAQRKAYYTKQANLHQQGVGRDLKNIEDSSMPITSEVNRKRSREG